MKATIVVFAIVSLVLFGTQVVAQEVARPIPLGVSGGNVGEYVDNNGFITCCGGTLGAPVIGNADGNLNVLGANHVIGRLNLAANQPGQDIVQPGLDQNKWVQDKSLAVANFSQLVPIKFASGTTNVDDAAVAKAIPGMVSTAIAVIGGISGSTATAAIGLGVKKVGTTTGLTTGTVEKTGTTVDITLANATEAMDCNLGGGGQSATFVNQIEVGPFSNFAAAGDSGALVVTQEACPRAIGIVMGGDVTTGYAVINPIGRILKDLNMKVAGSCTAPASTTLAQNQITPYTEAEAAAKRVLSERGKDLLKIDGVVGTALERGSRPGEVVIVLEVRDPTKIDAVRNTAPASIEGVPIDVEPVHKGVGY